jgi:hypothetical protein
VLACAPAVAVAAAMAPAPGPEVVVLDDGGLLDDAGLITAGLMALAWLAAA